MASPLKKGSVPLPAVTSQPVSFAISPKNNAICTDPPVIDIGGSRLCQQSRQKSGGHITQQSRHRPEQSTLPAAPDTEHGNGDYGQIVEPPRLIHPLFHRNSLLEVHTVDLVVSQQKDIAVLFQEGGVGVPQRNRCQRISVKVVRDNIAGIHDDSISAGHTHALR